MPSRGARLVSGRLFQLQCRSLSSTSRPPPRLPTLLPSTTTLLRPYQWSRYTPLAIPTTASIRHASTAPAPPVAQTAAVPPPSVDPTPFPDVTNVTLDEIDLSGYDISQIPEKIGYLQEIGLTWWYGPTSSLEWLLEHIHVYSGLPWSGSIALTAVVIRIALLKSHLKASDSSARAAAMASITNPITKAMQEASRSGDNAAAVLHWQQLAAVKKRAGFSMTAPLIPMVLQGVIGFCALRLLRAMSELPVPGLRDGGFLWLSDLTVPDPYGILPIAMAATLHLIVRLGGESGAAPSTVMGPMIRNVMLYAMPGVLMLVMAWQPGTLCVWFTVSGGLGMAQALLLQRPAVRTYLNLAPIYKPPQGAAAPPNPFNDLMDMIAPKKQGPVVDVRATSGAAGGKTAAPMQAQWQAPSIRTSASLRQGPVLDVKGTSATSEAPGQGYMSGLKERWRGSTEQAREKRELSNKKAAADAYERRAKQRERDGRR
ncbi:hypothetical protein LTR53_005659 [Teratosphaeriaceae sp. CCFEE 6253]|nr:hypothetical protein LTR53_005659 [Teratosphaeriaceae sp. CCFEE 6253]